MTTPERLKRRQTILASLVIVMGLTLILQSLYFRDQDVKQRDCLSTTMEQLTDSLEARSVGIENETRATHRIWKVYTQAAKDLRRTGAKQLPQSQKDRLQGRLIEALLHYDAVVNRVQQEREKNPIPPYPEGTCDNAE